MCVEKVRKNPLIRQGACKGWAGLSWAAQSCAGLTWVEHNQTPWIGFGPKVVSELRFAYGVWLVLNDRPNQEAVRHSLCFASAALPRTRSLRRTSGTQSLRRERVCDALAAKSLRRDRVCDARAAKSLRLKRVCDAGTLRRNSGCTAGTMRRNNAWNADP